MPRTARASARGYCYHVLNRGNAQSQVFHDASDYQTFLRLLEEAIERLPLRLLAYCLMPNHFHLALWPHTDGDLSRWMQWLLTAHVRRYHRHYQSNGHVWQGRFKAFPVQHDDHLLTVLRYIERNPLRAGLVRRAEEWPWSSLHAAAATAVRPSLHPGPVCKPCNWSEWVNAPMTDAELTGLRHSVRRGTPFGSPLWQLSTARDLGFEASLRPWGRPRLQSE
jgi:putative transposase